MQNRHDRESFKSGKHVDHMERTSELSFPMNFAVLSGKGSTSDLLKTGPSSPMRSIGRFRIIDAKFLKSKGRFQNFLELHIKTLRFLWRG
jgi:hypothetical protein